MGGIITLNGDYGLTQYRYNRGTADAIDASNATWTVANAGDTMNRYPFLVDNATSGISVYGATIDGTVSMTGEWLQLYVNSAAFMIRDSALAKVYDLRISDAWDALRVAGDSEGFEISNVWVSDVRDDAFENDNPVSGSISDSLFDGVFSGISLGHKNMADARNEVLVLDNVLIRMESYLFKGEMTHQSPFKLESLSPKLQITNTVIAIDDVDHVGQPRLQLAWDKTIASSNNVFLNLSDTPLPADYPTPPAGWTVLQGQAARDYWTTAQQAWVDSRGDVATATTSTEPTPETGASESADAETAHVPSSDLAETSTATELGTGVTLLDTGEIELDGTVFNRLSAGALAEVHFEVAGRAGDPDDYVMYKWKTGELFYDPDGNGSEAPIKIAQLASRLGLDYSDFVVTENTSVAGVTEAPVEPGNVDAFLFHGPILAALQAPDGADAASFDLEAAARPDDTANLARYKWKNGDVFYDPDGRGGESQIEIELANRLSLDHADFLTI